MHTLRCNIFAQYSNIIHILIFTTELITNVEKTNDMTLSDEDNLLREDATMEAPTTSKIAPSQQINKTKVHRNKLLDSNRLRAHSMGDISRLPTDGRRFTLDGLYGSANTNSTPNSAPFEMVGDHTRSTATQIASLPSGSAAVGAVNTRTPAAPQANKKTATLSDVRQILDANASTGAPNANTFNTHLRPPLNSTSTPNKNDGAKKRTRRGGKKHKEWLARKAQRDMNSADGTMGANANEIANLHQQNLQGMATKRNRTVGNTPPEFVPKSKKMASNRKTPATSNAMPTMADAVIEANLVVAIFDSPANGVLLPLDKAKYNKLYESINNAIFAHIERSSDIPTFDENKHVRGVMKVKCSTPAAKAWLVDAINCTQPLWPNMHLNVVDFDKLPQQTRILGLFTNCKIDAEHIRRMLNAMNPTLNIACWTILSSKITAKGAHVAFGIDKLQLDMLKANHFKLHFGAGSAFFKDISKKKPEQKESNEAEMDVDIEDIDLETSDDDDNITVITNNTATGKQPNADPVTLAQGIQTPSAKSEPASAAKSDETEQNTTPHSLQTGANGVNEPASTPGAGNQTEHGAT